MQNTKQAYYPYYFILITAALLAAVSFFRVHGFHDPSGGDGYFYLKQTEWLISHGQFYHADYSFLFLPLAILTKLTGSSLMAYQLLSCVNLLLILMAVGFFSLISFSSFKSYQQVLLAVALLVAFSFQMPVQRLSVEFIKNGFAFGLLLIGIALLQKKYLKTALVLIAMGALTHKLVALLVALGLFTFIFQRKNINKRFLILTAVAASILLAANPRLLKHAANFFDLISIEKMDSLFSPNSHLIWSHVALIFFWLIVFVIQIKKINRSHNLPDYQKTTFLTLFVFAVMPLIPVFAGSNAEIKWRLMISSFCFSFVLFLAALTFLTNKKVILSTIAISLILMSYEAKNISGYPWISPISYQLENAEALTAYVKAGEELIAHHGIEFYIDYKTTIRAKSLLTPGQPPKYQVAYIPKFFLLSPDLADAINQIKLMQVGPEYGLFYYADFQELLKNNVVLKHWKNVFKIRPEFVQSY